MRGEARRRLLSGRGESVPDAALVALLLGNDAPVAVVAARELLEQCVDGEREREFERRARALAETTVADGAPAPGLPPQTAVLDEWISGSPEEAREKLDEIAILVGQGLVENGARWRISLALDQSVVVRDDGASLNPFATVARRFDEPEIDLEKAIELGWRPESTP